mgnify:CR=1 FL=1
MQNSSPTLEQLFLEIQGLKKEVETLRAKRGKDAHHIEQLTNDLARLKRDTDYTHRKLAKETRITDNFLEEIQLQVRELMDRSLPNHWKYQNEIMAIVGAANLAAPERLRTVPKTVNKTDN